MLKNHLYDLPGTEMVSVSGLMWEVLSYARGQRIESYFRYTDVNYWKILQFDFLEGRPYTQDEFDSGAPVVVINEAMQNKFFGQESATGKTVTIAGKNYRVTGVVSNVPFTRFIPYSDMWAPLTIESVRKDFDKYVGMYIGLILAKDKSYIPQIKEEFKSRLKGIDLEGSRFRKVVSVPETTLEMSARVLFSQGRSDEAAVLLYLALMNILRNSIEAIDLNGTITISIEEENGNHILLITDTGEGLSSEAKDQLFTPFFSTKPNGQGIGLTLVNEILSRHNFKFKLTCQPEFPTRFSIFL